MKEINELTSEELQRLNVSREQLHAMKKYYGVWRREQKRLDSDINNPDHPEINEEWAWGIFVDWLESGNMTTDELREYIESPLAPHCPYCKRSADVLIHTQMSEVKYDFGLTGVDDMPNYTDMEVMSGDDGKWFCPACNKLITDNEEQALEFLKGNPNWGVY